MIEVMRTRLTPLFLIVCALFVAAPAAHADIMSRVSDLISTSAPNAHATHTIQFTLVQAVPPSGSITITPAGAFSLPSGFGAGDVSLSVATSGSYVGRTLASVAGSDTDGVSAVTGSSPSLTLTLNTSRGIPAGAAVRVILASTTASAYDPVNPASLGSYRIRISTSDDVGNALDVGTAMIAIVAPVTTSSKVIQVAPIRSNGEPSGTVAANNPVIEISLTTDRPANCRYATTTGVAYADMTHTFSRDSSEEVFYTDLSGFQNNTSYAFYVRCISIQGIVNTDDYPITFKLQPTPNVTTSETSGNSSGNSVSSGGGGIGAYPYGSQVLYLGTVNFVGSTSPSGTVTVLKDGVAAATARAADDGSFKASVSDLERGTYTFGIYTTDSNGVKTSADSETLSVGQGSSNTITGILVPPSIALATDTIAVGADAGVSGQTIPATQVEVSVLGAKGPAQTYTATSTSDGSWSVSVPGSDLSKGTYQIEARAVQSADSISNYSAPSFLGVGGKAAPSSLANPDLNGDGKVNLVDFSIFLTMWNTSAVRADFNGDGKVNLADFSIMLFDWTG